MWYKIPTGSGQSGGPVLKEQGGKFYAIGIHILSDMTQMSNVCVRLSEEKRR